MFKLLAIPAPKGLQRQITWYVLLPVALIMLLLGAVSFIYARNILLQLWSDAAIVSLDRAAHTIDMRLRRPQEMLAVFNDLDFGDLSDKTKEMIISQLRRIGGVVAVNVNWPDSNDGSTKWQQRSMGLSWHRMNFQSADKLNITSPRFDAKLKHETVSIKSFFKNDTGSTAGEIEVVMSFPSLTKDILGERMSTRLNVLLVDSNGAILTSTFSDDKYLGKKVKLGDSGDPLEQDTFAALQVNKKGTLLGSGLPPHRVSGYFQLQEVPWTLVVFAPGSEVMAPIIKFRTYYLALGALSILVIVLLIYLVSGRTVKAVKRVSKAANSLAAGDFSVQLPNLHSNDEIDELVSSFNSMVGQLEEGMRVKEGLNLAKEVQQNLLPTASVNLPGLEVAGNCLYCDETGGDFYDYIHFQEADDKRLGLVVGDVVGHGISAALLMATCRSLVRSRVIQPGTLAEMVSDVNRLLCRDTQKSGSFVTMFFMVLDSADSSLRWVRAGHDPALVYDVYTDSIRELKGEGVVLGIDESWQYSEYEYSNWQGDQVIFIGTDGVWDVQNSSGEMFGRERVKQFLAERHELGAQEMSDAFTCLITAFMGDVPQNDDITYVIVKTSSPGTSAC